jgi:glutaredoxin
MIIVYTKSNCSACEKYKPIIRKICDDLGLKLIIKDITNNQEAIDQLKFIGIKGIPVTIIDNHIYEGCHSEKYIKEKIEEIMYG